MEDQRRGGWLQTYTGAKFYPMDPRPEEIRILDIAHALSQLVRFAGHVRFPYTVAQHSVLASKRAARENKLWALLHDATEAYLVDLPRPVKHSMGMETYRQAEHDLMMTICQRFGLCYDEPAEIKEVDFRLCSTEARDLLGPIHPDWTHLEPYDERIYAWSMDSAKASFITQFALLGRPEDVQEMWLQIADERAKQKELQQADTDFYTTQQITLRIGRA
jgi:hypothetical protein